MPVCRPFKAPALTGGSGTTAILQDEPPQAAPGNTDGEGGGSDPDGGSGTPAPVLDSNAQPSAAGGPENERKGESPEVTEDGAAKDSADDPVAAPEEAANKASGDDDDIDEELFDSDDDKGAAPPAKPPRRVSSRVLGVPPPAPAGDVPGAKKGKVAKDGGESAQAGQDRVASELADEV